MPIRAGCSTCTYTATLKAAFKVAVQKLPWANMAHLRQPGFYSHMLSFVMGPEVCLDAPQADAFEQVWWTAMDWSKFQALSVFDQYLCSLQWGGVNQQCCQLCVCQE